MKFQKSVTSRLLSSVAAGAISVSGSFAAVQQFADHAAEAKEEAYNAAEAANVEVTEASSDYVEQLNNFFKQFEPTANMQLRSSDAGNHVLSNQITAENLQSNSPPVHLAQTDDQPQSGRVSEDVTGDTTVQETQQFDVASSPTVTVNKTINGVQDVVTKSANVRVTFNYTNGSEIIGSESLTFRLDSQNDQVRDFNVKTEYLKNVPAGYTLKTGAVTVSGITKQADGTFAGTVNVPVLSQSAQTTKVAVNISIKNAAGSSLGVGSTTVEVASASKDAIAKEMTNVDLSAYVEAPTTLTGRTRVGEPVLEQDASGNWRYTVTYSKIQVPYSASGLSADYSTLTLPNYDSLKWTIHGVNTDGTPYSSTVHGYIVKNKRYRFELPALQPGSTLSVTTELENQADAEFSNNPTSTTETYTVGGTQTQTVLQPYVPTFTYDSIQKVVNVSNDVPSMMVSTAPNTLVTARPDTTYRLTLSVKDPKSTTFSKDQMTDFRVINPQKLKAALYAEYDRSTRIVSVSPEPIPGYSWVIRSVTYSIGPTDTVDTNPELSQSMTLRSASVKKILNISLGLVADNNNSYSLKAVDKDNSIVDILPANQLDSPAATSEILTLSSRWVNMTGQELPVLTKVTAQNVSVTVNSNHQVAIDKPPAIQGVDYFYTRSDQPNVEAPLTEQTLFGVPDGTTVTVIAKPKPGYQLTNASNVMGSVTVSSTPVVPRVVSVTSTHSTVSIAGPQVQSGISYYYTRSDRPGRVDLTGPVTLTDVPVGTTVEVHAVAKPGYVISGSDLVGSTTVRVSSITAVDPLWAYSAKDNQTTITFPKAEGYAYVYNGREYSGQSVIFQGGSPASAITVKAKHGYSLTNASRSWDPRTLVATSQSSQTYTYTVNIAVDGKIVDTVKQTRTITMYKRNDYSWSDKESVAFDSVTGSPKVPTGYYTNDSAPGYTVTAGESASAGSRTATLNFSSATQTIKQLFKYRLVYTDGSTQLISPVTVNVYREGTYNSRTGRTVWAAMNQSIIEQELAKAGVKTQKAFNGYTFSRSSFDDASSTITYVYTKNVPPSTGSMSAGNVKSVAQSYMKTIPSLMHRSAYSSYSSINSIIGSDGVVSPDEQAIINNRFTAQWVKRMNEFRSQLGLGSVGGYSLNSSQMKLFTNHMKKTYAAGTHVTTDSNLKQLARSLNETGFAESITVPGRIQTLGVELTPEAVADYLFKMSLAEYKYYNDGSGKDGHLKNLLMTDNSKVVGGFYVNNMSVQQGSGMLSSLKKYTYNSVAVVNFN